MGFRITVNHWRHAYTVAIALGMWLAICVSGAAIYWTVLQWG